MAGDARMSNSITNTDYKKVLYFLLSRFLSKFVTSLKQVLHFNSNTFTAP
jgi:hypothetical protein